MHAKEQSTTHARTPGSPPSAVELFARLGLSPRAAEAVNRIGFEEPTEIQIKFIPAALTGRDCVGRAKTGTGKTAAFLLPIFEHFFLGENIRALILAPTRELAEQITVESKKLAGSGPPRAVAVYGGKKIGPQIELLRGNPEIVAATPGRLLDLHQRRAISLPSFSIVVVDEVDRMFDMGFRKDISDILNRCRGRRQTMFLSATLPEEIMRMANRFLKDPIGISAVEASDPLVATLDQRYFSVISAISPSPPTGNLLSW
ncbi:MAG: DEAD/DEAH box helicase [Candidatus Aureabacteria bacterium]|nr:DEAD/DEAH box helicase [Candidatus Auribacterota bacterium]